MKDYYVFNNHHLCGRLPQGIVIFCFNESVGVSSFVYLEQVSSPWVCWPASGVVSSAADMPTQLEMAMDTVIRTFHHYSCKEGN